MSSSSSSSTSPPTDSPTHTTSTSTTHPTTPASTSTPPTSTTSPASTSTPPTSSSPSGSVTTSQSSSSIQSSSSSTTSSSPVSSSTTQLQNTTSFSTPTASTAFQTTLITTNAQGSTVTVQTTAFAPTNTPSTTHNTSNNSHTGAIVGGTVGGVTGLAILGLLLFYCLRRQRRKDDFDGNFDPDRVGHNQGPLDLTAGEVEPYTYPQESGDPGHVGMREGTGAGGVVHQYYNTSPGARHEYGEDSRSPTETHTTTSYLAPNAGPVAGAGAGLAYAPSSSTSLTPPRSAKEQEAFSRFNSLGSSAGMSGQASGSAEPGLRVMNQPDDSVVVHQDGGRVRIPADEEPVEREIPPTYDSIPPDDSRR